MSAFIDGKNIYSDWKKKEYYKVLNSSADVIIDLFGIINSVASIELKYTKQGVIFAAEQLARLKIEIDKYFANMYPTFYFGVNIR